MTPATPGSNSFIRPFIITGGRTEVRHSELRLDTLISARGGRSAENRDFEHRAVLERCIEPVSIAEVAAFLDLPVGVVTVVVDDLLEDNLVTVRHSPTTSVSTSILERLVEGVRAL